MPQSLQSTISGDILRPRKPESRKDWKTGGYRGRYTEKIVRTRVFGLLSHGGEKLSTHVKPLILQIKAWTRWKKRNTQNWARRLGRKNCRKGNLIDGVNFIWVQSLTTSQDISLTRPRKMKMDLVFKPATEFLRLSTSKNGTSEIYNLIWVGKFLIPFPKIDINIFPHPANKIKHMPYIPYSSLIPPLKLLASRGPLRCNFHPVTCQLKIYLNLPISSICSNKIRSERPKK